LSHANSVAWALGVGQAVAFLRDAVIVAKFGAVGVTDAYFVAISFPDLILQVSLAGAASSALIPLLERHAGAGGDAAEWGVVGPVMMLFVALGTAAVTVGLAATPKIVSILAPGFGPETARLAVLLARITMPCALFLMASGLLAGWLNFGGTFFLPAMQFVVQSTVIALFALVFGHRWGITSAAVGFFLGSILAASLLLSRVWHKIPQKGFLAPRLTPGLVREFATLALPITLTATATQLTLVAEKLAATLFVAGSVAAIVLARKVGYVLVYVGSQSYVTAVYPTLVRAAAGRGERTYEATLRSSVLVVLSVMTVVAVLLWISADWIVPVLLRRGAFSARDAENVASLVRWFAVGIPIFSLNSLLIRAYYAQNRALEPLLISAASLVIYAVGLLVLPRTLGVPGIVAALIVSDTCRLFLMGYRLHVTINRVTLGVGGVAPA